MDETIGARLRAAREQRRLTIEEASEATRVRPHYLEALETDDLSALASTAQARGFLRIYADFLGLEGDDLLPRAQSQNVPAGVSLEEAASVPAPSQPSVSRPSLIDRLRQRMSRNADADAQPQVPEFNPAKSSIPLEEAQPNTKKKSPELRAVGRGQITTPRRSDAQALSEPESPGGPPDLALDVAASQVPKEVLLSSPASESQAAPHRRNWIADLIRKRGSDHPATPAHARPVDDLQTEAASGLPAVEAEAPPQALGEEPAEPQAAREVETSGQIFAEIGRQLRDRREMLSLTHEEIERYTRVRAEFLAGLEDGSLEELSSPVQTRGILANYASFLDLDSEAILLRFAEGLQARQREQQSQRQPTGTRQSMTVHTTLPPLRSFIASDLLFGVGVAVMLLLFAAWGISRVISVQNSSQARATSVSIAEVLAGTPAAAVAQEVTLIPAQDTPLPASAAAALPAEAATLDPNAAVQIGLQTSERAFIRITVDGTVAFEGRTEPNAEYTYQGSDRIEILVGNASALRVTYNGRDLGILGNFGEVVDRIYTAQGVETPTATLAPTPTATPNYTATPSQTPTRTPSVTPTPQAGG